MLRHHPGLVESDLWRLKVLELIQDGLSWALIYVLFHAPSSIPPTALRTHRMYRFATSLIAMPCNVNCVLTLSETTWHAVLLGHGGPLLAHRPVLLRYRNLDKIQERTDIGY